MKLRHIRDKMQKIILIFILIFIGLSCVLSSTSHGEIDREKTYKFAGDYSYPPYEFIDSEGNFVGFNIDIIRAVADSQDINIEIIPMEWHSAVYNLENGKIDGIIGMSESDERRAKFLFTSSTVENEQAIFVKKENVFIKDIKDLEGLTIGYQVGDLGEEYIENIKNSISSGYINQERLLLGLTTGEIDAAIGNKLVGIYYIQKKNLDDDIKVIENNIVSSPYGIATSKENTELASALEDGLKEIKGNNSYENIYKKWLGDRQSRFSKFLERHRMAAYAISMFGGFLILFLILYNKTLKSQVLKRTLQLEMANDKLLNSQREIYNLAYYDVVTSLPNRTSFVQEIDNIFKNKRNRIDKFSVLFLDLDKFKHVNDTLGHNTGDEILKLLSFRLKNVVGNDCVLAKAGGDEYFILQNNIIEDVEIIELAEKIINDFKTPYHIKDYKLIGFEALVRWLHPDKGLVPPNDFIPLAEETGLIVPMGKSILKKASLQIKDWVKEGHDVVMSVNISARQFQDTGFISDVELILREIELDPKFLTIEITETTAI